MKSSPVKLLLIVINIKAEFSIVPITRPPAQYGEWVIAEISLTLTINADRPENLVKLSCRKLLNLRTFLRVRTTLLFFPNA